MAILGISSFVALACFLAAVNAQQCGRAPIQPGIPLRSNGRIIGGTDARPHSWPWQAMFMHQRKGELNGQFFHCGASVISKHFVLTAAHCCDLPPSMNVTGTSVLLGQHSTTNVSEPFKKRYTITETIIHERYNKPTPINNDICLLYIAEGIDFNDHVQPICLPPNSDELPVGTECWITGWGNTNPNVSQTAILPAVLKQVDVKVVKKSTCNAVYFGMVTDKMVCVQNPGKGSCNGDSGGPLQCKDKTTGNWHLYGDTSFGSAQGCAGKRHPSVYCSVPSELDWIQEKMSKYPQ